MCSDELLPTQSTSDSAVVDLRGTSFNSTHILSASAPADDQVQPPPRTLLRAVYRFLVLLSFPGWLEIALLSLVLVLPSTIFPRLALNRSVVSRASIQ